MLINLPKRGRQAGQRRDPRLTARGSRCGRRCGWSTGRMFRPGTSEIIAGKGIAERLRRRRTSARRCASRSATGPWSASSTRGGTGFDSEIWGDAEQMMQAFRRTGFLVGDRSRLDDAGASMPSRRAIEADPRLTLEAKREQQFYAEQSRGALQLHQHPRHDRCRSIFSIGAMIGAMITMYAAVANRTGEIGTLRALGFRRSPSWSRSCSSAAAGARRRHRRARRRVAACRPLPSRP